MAQREVTAKLSWRGVKKFSGDVKGAGRQIEQSFDKGKRKVKQFETQANRTAKNMKASFAGVSKILGPLGLGVGITAAVLGIKKLISNTIKYRDEIAKASTATGLQVEFLSAMGFAAERSGSSLQEMQIGFRGLLRKMQDVKDGLLEGIRVFDQLGVEVRDTSGNMRSGEEVFLDVADAFSKLENETEKAALAQEIFGRSGIKLVPLLNEGRAGIEALRKEAKRLGIVFDEKAAREAEAAADAMTNFRTALRGLSDKTIPKVLPALTNLSNKLAEVISQSEDPIDFIIRLFFVPPNADELMKKTLERAKGLHLLDQVKITTADIPQHFRDIQKEASKAEIEFEKLVEKTVKQNEQLLETQRLTQKVEKLDAKRNEQLFARGEQEAMSAFFRRESADLISQELEFVGAATTARAKTLMLENKLADERAEASHESDIIRFIWQDIGSAISNAVAQGQNFSSVLSNIKKQLIGLGIRGAIGAAIGFVVGGPPGAAAGFSLATGIPTGSKGKQHGGPVFKGAPVLVGERGPELFVPTLNGKIIPNRQSERIIERNFTSSPTIIQNVHVQSFNESNVKNVLLPMINRLVRDSSSQLIASTVK